MSKLADLKEQVMTCNKCGLLKTRNKSVPSSGDKEAKVLFIGEEPDRNEDLKGKPFVATYNHGMI